jgi:hypothetical protein
VRSLGSATTRARDIHLKGRISSRSRVAALIAVVALLFGVGCVAFAEVIPGSRTAPWQGNVGVPGGIPKRTKIYKDIVADLGADPAGAKDCSPIIQSAINKCPNGQVVYIPDGRFRVETPVHIGNNTPNLTLRGAGMRRTTLFGPNNNPIFTAGDAPWPPPDNSASNFVQVSSGATKGSNTITVKSTSKFVIGAPMAIAPNPLPAWAHNLGGFPDTLRSMRVYFKVRSKTPTTVTFDPPCPFDFSGLNPTALVDPTPYMQGVGIESLTLDMSNNTTEIPLWFQQAWGCWAKEVEIKRAYTRQMRWDMVVRCEVRGCYTQNVQGSGPNHEGIEFSYASWNLIEDNICNNGGAPPIILEENITSSSCNVIGYNYVTNTDPGFWDLSFSHGSGSILNLAEGNVINNFEDDGYYGSSSYNTLFRNRISGQVRLKHFSDYYNVVGNILGDSWANTYETDVADYWDQGIAPIYELGFPNIGNASYTGPLGPTNPPDYHALPNTLEGCQELDRNVTATILRHGNWDYATQSVVWDPSIVDHTIPSSLYYSTQPAWWPAGVSWPPIGPDRNPMIGQIPAQIRFFAQSSPTPTPTVSPTPSPTATATATATPRSTPRPRPTPRPRH